MEYSTPASVLEDELEVSDVGLSTNGVQHTNQYTTNKWGTAAEEMMSRVLEKIKARAKYDDEFRKIKTECILALSRIQLSATTGTAIPVEDAMALFRPLDRLLDENESLLKTGLITPSLS